MNYLSHFLINISLIILSKLLFNINNSFLLIFFIAGLLMDIDHLIFFAVKTKSFSLKKWSALGNKMRKKMQPGFYVFHSPEFCLIIMILSFFHVYFLIILINYIIHISIDITEHYTYHKNFRFIKTWSVIYQLNNWYYARYRIRTCAGKKCRREDSNLWRH